MAAKSKKTLKPKQGNNKILAGLLKKYPNLPWRVVYYLMLAGLMTGAAKIYNSLNESDDVAAAPVVHEVVMDAPPVEKPATFAEFLEKMRPIEPLIIADLISKEGVMLDKNGMHAPYYNKIGKCWTIGFGSTILQDGSRVKATTKPLTTQQAYELARWHLEQHTLFTMYCYEAGVDSVNIDSTGEAFAIASVIYNTGIKTIEKPSKGGFKNLNLSMRTALLYQDFKKYGNELPASLVRQRFEEYPVTNPESVGEAWLGGHGDQAIADAIGNFLGGGGGILWRRWLESGVMLGEINPVELLESPFGAMSVFVSIVGKKRENWFTGDAPNRQVNKAAFEQFRQWLKNPVDKHGYSLARYPKVKDYLPESAREMCESGLCTIGNKEFLAQFDISGKRVPQVKFDLSKKSKYVIAGTKLQLPDNSGKKKIDFVAMTNRGDKQ